jgi:hypothetical protein
MVLGMHVAHRAARVATPRPQTPGGQPDNFFNPSTERAYNQSSR